VERSEAAQLLGVAIDAAEADVRAAYRRLLLQTHPDVSADADATGRTVRLTEAFAVLSSPAAPVGPSPGSAAPTSGRTAPSPPAEPFAGAEREPFTVSLVDSDTIAVAAPPDETLLLVMETAHRLGEISYLDPGAGLVEVIVEFVEAPTSSVLMSLQGRATGVTDVFCTVEPLSGGDAPPGDAVTRLVLATMGELQVDAT
jgi:hypothetical protein